MSIAFEPTPDELELLRQLAAGVALPMPTPTQMEAAALRRLYENGFVMPRVGGELGLTLRGGEVLARARAYA